MRSGIEEIDGSGDVGVEEANIWPKQKKKNCSLGLELGSGIMCSVKKSNFISS